MSFKSSWKGRIFFAVNRGSMLWSLVESHESWTSEKIHREVWSCLESTLVEPIGLDIWAGEIHRCSVGSSGERINQKPASAVVGPH